MKRWRWRHRAGATLLGALAASAGCAAQAQVARPDAMLTVEVVGVLPQAGPGVARDALPYAVQTATSEAIRASQSDNLSDFMARNLSGVNVNDISGSPFQSDITFRGFRASPVLGTAQGMSVYLDGVRVNEPFGDVVNWDMLPEAAIANILLVPGSNPLYGLNTLGGALALNTKSGLSDPGLDGGLSYGSGGQRRADFAYGVNRDEHWHALIAATLFDDKGWRAHSAGHLANFFLKAGHTEGARAWSVALLGGASQLIGNGLLPSYRLDGTGVHGGLYEDAPRAAYTYPDETRNRLRQATFNFSERLAANAELALNAYVRNSRRDTVNGDVSDAYGEYLSACARGFGADGAARDRQACALTRAEGAALDSASLNATSTRQNGEGLSANLSATLGRHQLAGGASIDRGRVSFAQYQRAASFSADRAVLAEPDAERVASTSVDGSARALGLYLADTWSATPATHVTASACLNRARVGNTLSGDAGPQPRETFDYQKLNPALGLAHRTEGGLILSANATQSNRVPSVIELGCADPAQPCRLPVGLQADPYLKQVVSRTVEAGVRWHGARGASVAASLYRTVNRDDILFRSAGLTQQGYFSNFERTKHQGLDLNATRRFGAVGARLSYSYLDAVYDADGQLFSGVRNVQVTSGTRIAGLPRHTLKLGADWQATPTLTLGAEWQAVSDLLTQGNEDGLAADPVAGQAPRYADWRIHGYLLLNLRATYRPDGRWEAYAHINNVADRRHASYGAVGSDLFPNGQLQQPQNGAVDANTARFVAPGAPRSVAFGLRYRF